MASEGFGFFDWVDSLLGGETPDRTKLKTCQVCQSQAWIKMNCRCGFRLRLCLVCYYKGIDEKAKRDLMEALTIHSMECINGSLFSRCLNWSLT